MPLKDKGKQKEYYRAYGRRPEVRERRNRRAREKRKTLEGWASVKYREMKCRCGKRKYYKNVKVLLSKEEFIDIVKKSNFKQLNEPSVDRIDSSGHYELGNIQIIEKRENDGRASRKHFGCAIDGCDNPHSSRGFCMKHYTRYVRRGTLQDMKRFGDRLHSCKGG
jgi:hypothetical protein